MRETFWDVWEYGLKGMNGRWEKAPLEKRGKKEKKKKKKKKKKISKTKGKE